MLIVQNSRRVPVTALVIAGTVVVTAVVAWVATSTPDTPDLPTGGVQLAARGTPQPTTGRAPAAVPPLPTDPTSAGAPPVDPARVFDLGIAGGLVVDATTVSSLDQLQAMLGDTPTPEAIARVERQLREGLPREEAERAIRLFEGYRGYTQDMRTGVMAMGVPQTREAADALYAQMLAVQTRHFDGATAEAMFAEQNRLSRTVLDASLVQMDPNLSSAQKKAQLDALRARLPEAQRHTIPDLPPEAASAPQ